MLISDAFAQTAAPAQSDASLMSLLPMIAIFVLFYFFMTEVKKDFMNFWKRKGR